MITTSESEKIELLPEHIIDQIKAGEVLERPASLIKELIENSIDAKSSEISIHIIDNGLELISLEDNGKGMSFDNLPYAFLRHATSKIKNYDDLFKLHSYGFRGEALASIAASSRVTCQTQPKNLDIAGGKIIINGGLEELLVPMKNTKNGTSFYIKNLFYNTPARLKFIKSKNSEKIQLKKIIYSFLLSHPDIQFSIKWDEKEKEVYKSVTNLNYQKRFEQLVYGKNKPTSPILLSSSTYEGHTLKIYFTLEAHKNSPNKHQYLFANGRIFYDKNLHMAIIRSTDSIWKYGESGHYIVLIDCPSDEIDVNVHPNKTQLKFSKSDIIYSLLVTNIKNAIKEFNSTSPIATNSNNLNEEIPMSFLTKDEEEKYSLQEIKDKTFFRKPIPSSVTQISSTTNNLEPIKKFYELNDHCFVLENSFKKFIVNKKLIFIHYLFSLCQDCLIKEENISPLLISEPFKIKSNIDIHFEAMKKMGFEFDRLNQEVIVLRTIPRLIHRDLIIHSAHFLLSYYETNPKNSFELLNIKKSAVFKNLNLILDSSLMYKIFETKLLNWPDCSIEINAETFSSFFHE